MGFEPTTTVLAYIRRAEENNSFYAYNDELYNMVDLYLLGGKYFEYEDSYNYYDIDVDKVLLYKKK